MPVDEEQGQAGVAEDTTISSSLDLQPRLADQEFFHLLVEEPTTGDLQLSELWQCLQGLQSLGCQGESVEGEELEVGCPREVAQRSEERRVGKECRRRRTRHE